jgi:hypothetical protein
MLGDPESGKLRAAFMASMGAAGMADRDVRLGWARRMLDRPTLESANDLTVTEARYLLDALREASEPPQGDEPDRPDYHPRA